MNKKEVKLVFCIKEKEQILVHLKDFEWEFQSFGVLYLCYEEKRIRMKYVGFGNHEGNPTLTLELNDCDNSNINEICFEIKNYKGKVFLER